MKLNVGDIVLVRVADTQLELTVKVEDASKSDIIQAKVETIADAKANEKGVFTYEIGKVYDFARRDIQENA